MTKRESQADTFFDVYIMWGKKIDFKEVKYKVFFFFIFRQQCNFCNESLFQGVEAKIFEYLSEKCFEFFLIFVNGKLAPESRFYMRKILSDA